MRLCLLFVFIWIGLCQVQPGLSNSVCTKADGFTRQPITINCPGLLHSYKYKYCCGTFENRYCCKKSDFRRYTSQGGYPYTTYRTYGHMGGFFSFLIGVLMIACCCSLANRLKHRQQMSSLGVFTAPVSAPPVHLASQPTATPYPTQPGVYPQQPYYPKPSDLNGYPMPPPPAYTPTAQSESVQHAGAPLPPMDSSYPAYPAYPSAPPKQ